MREGEVFVANDSFSHFVIATAVSAWEFTKAVVKGFVEDAICEFIGEFLLRYSEVAVLVELLLVNGLENACSDPDVPEEARQLVTPLCLTTKHSEDVVGA